MGKSQMLRNLRNIAPRGVYVCGNTTTVNFHSLFFQLLFNICHCHY